MLVSVRCPIAIHADAQPEALALVTHRHDWTYASLHNAVSRVAERLRSWGIHGGHRVALRWPRTAANVILIAALARLEAVVAPLSSRLPPSGVADACRQIQADALLCQDDAFGQAVAADGRRVCSPQPNWFAPPSPPVAPGTAAPQIALRQPATLIFTSGSTGRPKAALHTWGHHAASARGSAANLPLAPGDRWLLSLPLYHVGGLAILVRCVHAGATAVLPAPTDALADVLAARSITHASLVPTQLRRLLRATDRAPHSLKGVLLGGAALPPDLLAAALDAGWPLHATYGCTEMASQIATTPPGASREHLLHTAGRALPHVDLRTNADGPAGPHGEMLVRGASLFCGYVDETGCHPTRTPDGWYRTGDVGRIDSDGYLHVEGRADRMFISGGENIHPEEIEAALHRINTVTHAAVVPVRDAEFGQRPVAFVRTTHPLDPEHLKDRLAATLPRFKVPVRFLPLPDAALSGRMKVDRALLKKQARNLLYASPPPETGPHPDPA